METTTTEVKPRGRISSDATKAKKKRRSKLELLMTSLVRSLDLARRLRLDDKPACQSIQQALDQTSDLINSGYVPEPLKRKKKLDPGSKVKLKPEAVSALPGDWSGEVEIVTANENGFLLLKNEAGVTTLVKRRDIVLRNRKKKE